MGLKAAIANLKVFERVNRVMSASNRVIRPHVSGDRASDLARHRASILLD